MSPKKHLTKEAKIKLIDRYNSLIGSLSNKDAIQQSHEYAKELGYSITIRQMYRILNLETLSRNITINSQKIDPTRETEVQAIHSRIDSVLDLLTTKINKENINNTDCVKISSAIAKQLELKVKLIALSSKKTTISVGATNNIEQATNNIEQGINYEEIK